MIPPTDSLKGEYHNRLHDHIRFTRVPRYKVSYNKMQDVLYLQAVKFFILSIISLAKRRARSTRVASGCPLVEGPASP
jgi:hypothetical protein